MAATTPQAPATRAQADAKVAQLKKQKEKLDARLGKAAIAAAGMGVTPKSAARRARSKVRKELGIQVAAVPQMSAVPLGGDAGEEYDAIACVQYR